MEGGGNEALFISPRHATSIGAYGTSPRDLCMKPRRGPSDRGSGLEGPMSGRLDNSDVPIWRGRSDLDSTIVVAGKSTHAIFAAIGYLCSTHQIALYSMFLSLFTQVSPASR